MKVKLTQSDLGDVIKMAHDHFMTKPIPRELSSKEVQAYIILNGLESVMTKLGHDIKFDFGNLTPNKQEKL